jgi:ubiquinone/menaquinone biosynthesis C-methylase UbiE
MDSDGRDDVMEYFDAREQYWAEIYDGDDVLNEIYRGRQRVALASVDALGLPPTSRVLEVGSGAGLLTVELLRRSFHVHAVDLSGRMVEHTRTRAAADAPGFALEATIADVQALPFEECGFDLVVALGVVPWVSSPATAIDEMARVTKAGGHVLVTADNDWRLSRVLDPRLSPALNPLKRLVKRVFRGRQPFSASRHRYHSNRAMDDLQGASDLTQVHSSTFGFGPFTILGHPAFVGPRAVRLHRRLQHFADSGAPLLPSLGSHIIVLAEKPRCDQP